MKMNAKTSILLCGIAAGIVNGLFGTGGGMVLVPMLVWLSDLDDDAIFPTSVTIILPICIVSLLLSFRSDPTAFPISLPYLLGSGIGGILAGVLGKRIPTTWLHRLLGLFILWGGIRYLC